MCLAAARCLPRGVPACFCHPVQPSAPRERSRTSACACSREPVRAVLHVGQRHDYRRERRLQNLDASHRFTCSSTAGIEAPTCGTRASRIWTTGKKSTICSTVRRWTRSCGQDSARASGRVPPGSSYKLKSLGWGGGCVGIVAV